MRRSLGSKESRSSCRSDVRLRDSGADRIPATLLNRVPVRILTPGRLHGIGMIPGDPRPRQEHHRFFPHHLAMGRDGCLFRSLDFRGMTMPTSSIPITKQVASTSDATEPEPVRTS